MIAALAPTRAHPAPTTLTLLEAVELVVELGRGRSRRRAGGDPARPSERRLHDADRRPILWIDPASG